ncbi:MAG: LysM peptidoglycan-binding domain-containing protein [Rikenellaceae bacterium]
MKHIICILLLTCGVFFEGFSQQRSTTIVNINGGRFYVHKVKQGEDLTTLSRLYDVTGGIIAHNNSTLKVDGDLIEGTNLKIPVVGADTTPKSISVRKVRKLFDTHIIKEGETLYSIARKYQISVEAIMEDNPTINPAQLALDSSLMIRKSEQGKVSGEQSQNELSDYTDNLNKVAPEGYCYHLVEKGETLYSLLKDYDMSKNEFYDLNENATEQLTAGAIITMRKASVEVTQEDESDVNQYEFNALPQFSVLGRSTEANIALLLPLSSKSGSVSPPFAEFYQGFLMGVEQLRSRGRNIRLTLFDTQRESSKVSSIVKSESFKSANLIVGPAYEELMGEVIKYASFNSIPVVSPLATIKNYHSSVLFQMAPHDTKRFEKAENLLDSTRHITIIRTQDNDSDYEQSVKELIGSREYSTREFIYEHPSVVQERIKEAEKAGEDPERSPGDLTDIIGNDSLKYTIFIVAKAETDVDRILSAIASAEVSLRSKSQRVAKYNIIGNTRWNRFTNIDRSLYFQDRVVLFTSYHAKRDNQQIIDFDARYVELFGSLPSLYAYRGYDTAMIFGDGLYSDIEYGMRGRSFTPLQTTYRFEGEQINDVKRNINWMRVEYNPDYTITVK